MASRLDRLILLLDTGTSTQLRNTAAKQLADIAKRAFDRQLDVDSDSNPWPEALRLVSRIVPFLSSKSSETRNAAAEAVGLIAGALPRWERQDAQAVESFTLPFEGFDDIQSLIVRAPKLLASAGQEYVVTKGSGKDAAKQKKAMMGSLGLAPGVGWGDDVDKVVDEESDSIVKKEEPSSTPTPTPAVIEEPKDPYEGLSARQINMLKRKRKGGATALEEANKLNAQAHAAPVASVVASPSTNSTPVATPVPSPATTPRGSPKQEVVTVDPGAKARAAAAATAASGGQVEPSPAEAAANALITPPDQWPFTNLMQQLVLSLGKPSWEARHGSAMAIREILRSQGKACGGSALVSIAQCLLALLALDRFGDFVGDMVMAPVREAAAQALGIVLIHLPNDAQVRSVHDTLIQMVRQDWVSKDVKYAWEVRHAGLLGLKYQVAVRGDLLGAPKELDIKQELELNGSQVVKVEDVEAEDVKAEDIKKENGVKAESNPTKMEGIIPAAADTTVILKEVVDAAVLGLSDTDDDVRSVSAACLLPIASHLVTKLPKNEVQILLHVLWDCLSEGGDELGSSTGVVMDLLGKLITYDEIIDIFCETPVDDPRSVVTLVPRLFPYFRHTIAHVRLAVLKALQVFITVDRLPRAWIDDRVFRLIFQNLVVEERLEIRAATSATWQAAFTAVDSTFVATHILPRLIEWFAVAMTPMGVPLDASLFYRPVADKTLASKSKTGYTGPTYNVDKHMMAGDLSLVTIESVLRARIGAAEALAGITKFEPSGAAHAELLQRYLSSSSSHQLFLAAVIIEEWARVADDNDEAAKATSLAVSNASVQGLAAKLVDFLEKPPPATYHEMTVLLTRIQAESQGLVNAFAVEGKVKRDKLPELPTTVDALREADDVFSLATARSVAMTHFETLSTALSKAMTKTVLPALKERQRKLLSSIGLFVVMKEKYDVQVFAAMAGAMVALRTMPAKLNPIIRSIMNGVKSEDNELLQARFATSVGAFVEFCSSPLFGARANPSDKIVKNLCTFLCQDAKETPIFSTVSAKPGIISLQEMTPKTTPKGHAKDEVYESDEVIQARVTRRGARLALSSLVKRFGPNAFTSAPKLWEGMSGALRSTFPDGGPVSAADERLRASNAAGQDTVDCLTVLQTLVADLSPALHSQIMDLVKSVILALQSDFAVVRYAAAKCLATICEHMTAPAMKLVVEEVIPFLNDANSTVNRQGAIELVHHIIRVLDLKALPYVLFLIVPTLGRMSDSDVPVRLMATSTFAALIKMVPLEAGIPDPEGFSQELLAKRSEERLFLTQLLDGSKAEQYEIPVPIKAELRNYQKEGVSWLAFLARYQLHGILCDDMGLGKSLQSICILASKHHERAEKFKATGSVDSAHVPSLIVCPPTLTGHWYHEIGKFSDHLRPVLYTGNASQRNAIFPKLKNYDIVITSYEAVRNDIESLKNVNFLYCVLDEGHIIKNAKTKLTQAVKMIKANHRLLLSGTPIQNNVLELWSLFDFLMPGFLGTDKAFNEKFSKPILADRDGKATPKQRDAATAALEALHKQVLPFLLRRLKEDVLDDLPPKIIQDYYCELSDVQKQLYDEFSKSQSQDLADEVNKGEAGGAGQQHVFQSLQYLRKLCNHPALVMEKEPQKYQELVAKAPKSAALPASMYDISNAPKLEALKQLLTDCGIGTSAGESGQPALETESQHRVLIFCQLRPMLDLIENHLFKTLMPSVTYMRMDGQTEASKRHAVVQTFNGDPSIDVLLLTTQVGGLGLNLTGADTVIFVDHDWNPMKDLQAMDRAHRLGQKKVVNVYRLITRGTLEEKIMGLQRFKLNIASSVVTQQNSGLASMNTNEVLDLFQVSAEGDQKKPVKAVSGPATQSSVLEGLEDLPAEDEYEGLSLSSFMAKM